MILQRDFWYFVADHIDEFVMKPAQRAAVRKNVDYFLRRLQLPGLSVPLLLIPGEMKLMKKRELGNVCCEDGAAAMRCRPARAWIVRHLRLSSGKRMRREFVAMLWFKLIRELEWGALGRQPPGA